MRRSGRTAIHQVLAVCLGLFAAAFAVHAGKPVTIKEVRLWAGPDGTRLVFDLSEPVEHSVLTLDNPDRVVVDIPGAVIDNSRALPEGQGFVRAAHFRGRSAADVWPSAGDGSHAERQVHDAASAVGR
jgi:N-acetylmuramoyl-L-alanine amidase